MRKGVQNSKQLSSLMGTDRLKHDTANRQFGWNRSTDNQVIRIRNYTECIIKDPVTESDNCNTCNDKPELPITS
jgi:hypothetical protein